MTALPIQTALRTQCFLLGFSGNFGEVSDGCSCSVINSP
ncbi:hypothetical protein BV089_00388 [Haemophilus influenzae]|nr:hypothetical protein BV089_00388 [Haemophilus influenzae]